MFNRTAKDFMDEVVDCLHPEVGCIGAVIEFLEKAKHGGYPLTQSASDPTLLGYVHTGPLLKYLKGQLAANAFVHADLPLVFEKFMGDGKLAGNADMAAFRPLDISKFCDTTEMTCVAESTAVQVQSIFRSLGVKVILVREKGDLIGMITKKSFIHQMEELHHSDHAPAPVAKGGLREGLLPK